MGAEGILSAGALSELGVFSETERAEIVAEVLASLDGLIGRLAGPIEAGGAEQAVQLAHSARNDAWVVGARQLGQVLGELERCARAGDLAGAGTAQGQLAQLWPATRAAIAGLLTP